MPRSLDIDQLKAFLAICATGSFSRAAEKVHKTQAAVSVQMKRLEETVGARLIERSARHSTLTEEGQRLRDFAQRIVALNDEALTAMQAPDMSGLLRLGVPLYLQNFFPEILARFAETHPLVEIDIVSQPSQEMIAALREGALDLAVITHRSGGQVGEIVRSEKLYWVCAPEHGAHLQSVTPLALYHPASAIRQMAVEALERTGKPFRIAYSSPSTDALCAAAKSGLAVTIMPRCAIGPELRVLTEEHGFPELPDCDISLTHGPGSPGVLVRAVSDHIRECLRSYNFYKEAPRPVAV